VVYPELGLQHSDSRVSSAAEGLPAELLKPSSARLPQNIDTASSGFDYAARGSKSKK
jgi:hypothetical protein